LTRNPFVLVAADFVQTGGMDRANYAFASYLARAGHPVTIVGHRVDPGLAALPSIRVSRVWKPLGSYFLGQWPLARVGLTACRSGGRAVVNGGNCLMADVNWVHYVHAAYRPTVKVSLPRRFKAWIEHPCNVRAERAALRLARVVICNSELTRQQVVNLCGVEAKKAVTVYYGSDPQRFRPAALAERLALRQKLGWDCNRPVVLFIGALGDRRKGFDTLVDAWGRLCKKSEWDATLVVIGAGAELAAWQRHVAEIGLADCIDFLGFRTDVPDLLRAADALVAPTRYEAYGLGVQEAICCGLPAIVSASAGIAERYPAELSALLLPDPEDAADLTSRLHCWRAEQDAWRERVRPFSDALRANTWDDMSRRILEVSQ
jgi:glycosyltransferase involved in cell wall biosynthesis